MNYDLLKRIAEAVENSDFEFWGETLDPVVKALNRIANNLETLTNAINNK